MGFRLFEAGALIYNTQDGQRCWDGYVRGKLPHLSVCVIYEVTAREVGRRRVQKSKASTGVVHVTPSSFVSELRFLLTLNHVNAQELVGVPRVEGRMDDANFQSESTYPSSTSSSSGKPCKGVKPVTSQSQAYFSGL